MEAIDLAFAKDGKTWKKKKRKLDGKVKWFLCWKRPGGKQK